MLDLLVVVVFTYALATIAVPGPTSSVQPILLTSSCQGYCVHSRTKKVEGIIEDDSDDAIRFGQLRCIIQEVSTTRCDALRTAADNYR